MSALQLPMKSIEREAFLDFLSDYPRVIRTLQGEFPCDELCERAMVLTDLMEQRMVPDPLSPIDRAILKASIEKSDWLEPYAGQSKASKAHKIKQMAALRQCANLLEMIGVEVDHLPS